VTRRKGELTNTRIDREWPHQVVIAADQMDGKNDAIGREFCRDLSLCPRGYTVRREDIDYRVFCFADPAHADLFRERFGGEPFDPQDRGRGAAWIRWGKR
jgi:hypothetical protein